MKKGIIIISSLVITLCFVFVACTANTPTTEETGETTTTTEPKGLEANDVEYGFEDVAVTDAKGKEVTDAKGEKVTTEVQVNYKKDSNGKYVAQVVDDNGEPVTDKKGKEVTVKSEYADELNGITTSTKNDSPANNNTTGKNGSNNGNNNNSTDKSPTSGKNDNNNDDKTTSIKGPGSTLVSDETLPVPTTDNKTTTVKTDNTNVNVTKEPDTTSFTGDQSVPKTSDKGKEVYFSDEDYQKVASMLEVPYLYLSSYENSDGVPIDIATYTAVWMAQQNGESAVSYPSSPVVLNLFKFYGQTVVNFKTKCNDVDDAPIKYNKNNDTFTVNKYNEKKQSVEITKVEDMGNDNFYKVSGKVSGAGNIKNVIAIVQKNKLEPSLGFSIKALKWS